MAKGNTPPAAGSELDNLIGGGSPSLDVPAEQAEQQVEGAEVPESGWTPDDWSKQTVTFEAEATPGLGQPAGDVKPPSGFVPVGAIAELRGELRQRDEKIQRMNDRFEDTVRLFQARMEAPPQQQQQAPAPKPLPDAEKEPVAHMQARFERLEQALQTIVGMQQVGAGQAQIVQSIQADEMAYKASHPDYDQALNFVRSKRAQELTEDLGMTAQQAAQALANEEIMIAQAALRRGASPAEAAYKLAQRWGFKNGQANAQQAAAAAAKIAAAKAGGEVSSSLGKVAGSTPAGTGISLESLADIEDANQFAKAFDKLMNASRGATSQLPTFLRR